ncbi:MAG: thioredoxin family protein, partial [Butyricimonas faecihominis]
MKKFTLVLNLVCFLALGSFAQSMYGDAVKADVKMKYVYSFEEALKKAKEENKLIFFNCFADWAVPCHSMNKLVFSDQEFADWMDKHFVNFFIDVTTPAGRPFADKYKITFQAHYLVLNSDGEVVHRIVGGHQIPEFKAILKNALNPKTSLAGMNKRYAAGERNVKFLNAYADVLKIASEDETYKKVVEELFSKLKKSDWSKKVYWKSFCYMTKDIDSEMFKYMLDHKADFVKSNGEEQVNQFISNLYARTLYSYASGKEVYNGEKLLNIYLDIQKAGLPKENMVYSLYTIAKYRGEGDFSKMMDVIETVVPTWESTIAVALDLSLAEMKDLDKTDKERLINYFQKRSEKAGGAKKNYLAAISDMVNTEGIKFEDITFNEALKKAKEQGKLIFMDCYTVWCVPCKMLAKDVFTRPEVGDYFNIHFINVKMDMGTEQGKVLNDKYQVTGYPTLLFLDGDGNLIHRIVGAPTADILLKEGGRAIDGKGYSSMSKAYEEGNRQPNFIQEYMDVLDIAGEGSKAAQICLNYFKTLDKSKLKEREYWELFCKYVKDVDADVSKYVYKNRAEFINLFGAAAVEKKLFQLFSNGAY